VKETAIAQIAAIKSRPESIFQAGHESGCHSTALCALKASVGAFVKDKGTARQLTVPLGGDYGDPCWKSSHD